MGRFFGGLKSGVILGVRSSDGRVLVPPPEYDPRTAQPLGRDVADFVALAPTGVVESFTWIASPRRAHPLQRPFAWALVRLDGADSALLHAVDAGDPSRVRTGLRVRARFRAERVGEMRDIECFEPVEGGRA
jgi:uncharacterized OB-fold protein